MSYLKILFFLVLLFTGFLKVSANLLYPIQEMSRPECRFQNFSTLNGECKMPLPILETSKLEQYKNDYSLYRRVYTVLYSASYTYGWDVGNGGHSGVDIATARGTPVYSVADGKIVGVSNLAGRGNNIKIEHTINGRKVWTNYSHLHTMGVKVGDNIKAGEQIGTVGSTGNSTGNHLHFQVDLLSYNNKSPWYRRNCNSTNYSFIVNDGPCKQELIVNTIDPLVFLETNGAVVNAVSRPITPIIEKKDIMSREEIERREIEDFLRNYQVKLGIKEFGNNIFLGKTGTMRVSVINKRTKRPFSGSFPGFMNFDYDKTKFDLFPIELLAIDNGIRDIKITPKIAGNYRVGVKIGQVPLSQISFSIIDNKNPIKPTGVTFGRNISNVAGANRKGLLFLKNRAGSNILGATFEGNLTLTSKNKNMAFCIKKAQNISQLKLVFNSSCNEEDFKESVEFGYKDTLLGILLFDYKVLHHGNTYANVINNEGQNLTNTLFRGTLPLGINNTHPYYKELISLAKDGILTGINRGYYLQDRDLTHKDGIDMIKNTLLQLKSRCNNNACDNLIDTYLQNSIKIHPDRFKNLTRKEFIDMIGELIPLPNYNGDYMDFRDLTGESQIYTKNILKQKTWQDQFGPNRYFQPDKNITRGEGAYLIWNVLN